MTIKQINQDGYLIGDKDGYEEIYCSLEELKELKNKIERILDYNR